MEMGPVITAEGGTVAWVKDDDTITPQWHAGGWYDGTALARHCRHTAWRAIRLPSSHWAYPVLAAGFTPWAGGGAAPDDWDPKGPILGRDGKVFPADSSWDWVHRNNSIGDIIGYRRKSEQAAPDNGAELAAVFADTFERETVMLPVMTEEEWDNTATTDWAVSVGLVRRPSLLEQFEEQHGGLDNNQRDIIEAYQAWIAEQ